MLSDGVFGNIFESNNDFANFTCHAKLPIGNPITRPGEFTAVGNALNQIGMALRNAVKATRVEFTGNNIPPFLNLPDPNDIEYSSIYGWILEEVSPGPKQIILLNLNSNNDFKVTFNYSAANLNYTQLISNDATSAILGNAQINPTSPYELIQTNTSIAPNSSGDFEFILPPHSITRIYEVPSIKAHLTDPVICSGSSTTLIIDGGPENAAFNVTNSNSLPISILSIGGVGTNDTRHWKITAPSVSSNTIYTIVFECTTCVPVISQNINLTVHADISYLQIKDNNGNPITSPIERCANAGTPLDLVASFIPGSGGNPNTNNYTYIWTPDTGIIANGCNTNTLQLCNSISVVPQRTTTYTVFVTDDQCWKSASVVVEVPISELDLGEDFLVCSNSSTIELNSISTGSADLSYQWSPSGSTSPTLNYSIPTTPGSYPISLTVTDISSGSGCIVSDQVNIIVVQCCSTTTNSNSVWPTNQVNYETNLNEYYASGENLFNSLSTLCSSCISVFGSPDKNKIKFISNNTNQILQVNGELRLERDFKDNAGTLLKDGFDVEIKDLKIQFGEKAFIRVRGGRTLTLDGCTLEACGTKMWDGLRIFPEATDLLPAIVLKNCTIRNASNALYLARDSRFIIENCTFIDNYIDINLNTYLKRVKQEIDDQTNKSTEYFIRSNTFTSSGNTLLAPYDNVHKFAAIVLDDAERVVIGDSSLNASVSANEISESNYGAFIQNSSVEFYNTNFTDITELDGEILESPSKGACIYSFSNRDYNDRKITIGNVNATNRKNNFTASRFGFVSQGEVNCTVVNNVFGSATTVNDRIELPCINIGLNTNKKIFIGANNSFYDYSQGILLNNFTNETDVEISSNVFYNGVLNTPVRDFDGTAIRLNNTLPIQRMNNALIANNEIGVWDEPANNFYQPRIGIHVANTGGVEIRSNIISFNLTTVPLLNYRGIRLENAAECVISGNSIANRVADVGLQNQVVGIRLDNSSMPRINCNGLGNLGQGMQFVGNNDFVNLIENDFNQYDLGVMLGDGVNGTFIGDFQGSPGVGLDNSWVDDDADRVEGSVILPLPMPWYHRYSVDFENSFAPVRSNNTFSGAIEPFGNQPSVLNEPCAILTDPSAVARSAGFASIAADTARYIGSFSDEYLYLRKSAAYNYLLGDTGRITMRSEDDEAYETLYEVLSVTNISKIDSVIRLFSNKKWSEAFDLLESIEDTNSHEYYLKLVIGTLIGAAIENRVLNSSDTTALTEIGNLHSLEGGLAVKIARASLQREIEDVGSGSRLYKNEKNKTSEAVKIWPNPTSDILQVNRTGAVTYRVFDASMRLVLSGSCDNGIINVQDLNEGYYLLFVNYENSIWNEPIGFCKLK